jgi:hypothetical protein
MSGTVCLVLGGGLYAQFCSKTLCSLRLGGGLDEQFVAKYCVFGAWVGA